MIQKMKIQMECDKKENTERYLTLHLFILSSWPTDAIEGATEDMSVQEVTYIH